jgi:hypothetical protein
MQDATLPLVLDAMWKANLLDINATLAEVCGRVLEEEGVAKAELKLRAEGLKELGQIFAGSAATQSTIRVATKGTDVEVVREQMESAMRKAADKAKGFDPEDA